MTKDPRKLAADLVTRLGFRHPPVMVRKACRALRIPVKILPLDRDGYSVDVGGHPFIFLSSRLSRERLRWTAAHELGHVLLGHGPMMASDGTGPLERPAHVFAEELLMPSTMVNAMISKAREMAINPIPEAYAPRFGVSVEAMRIKLKKMIHA
jgi:Zn-dependent peptidase ImmA (M78 family)